MTDIWADLMSVQGRNVYRQEHSVDGVKTCFLSWFSPVNDTFRFQIWTVGPATLGEAVTDTDHVGMCSHLFLMCHSLAFKIIRTAKEVDLKLSYNILLSMIYS